MVPVGLSAVCDQGIWYNAVDWSAVCDRGISHNVVVWSAVCDCGTSLSYSLFPYARLAYFDLITQQWNRTHIFI